MVFLKTDSAGRVTLRHNRPEELTEEEKEEGVLVDSVPERPGGEYALFVEDGSPAWKMERYRFEDDLPALKEHLKEKVLKRQQEEETAPVTLNGNEFPAGRDSQGRIGSAIQQVEASGTPFPALTTDGSQVELSLSDLKDLSGKYADQVRSARARAQELLSTIESATSADTLLGLDINTGW
ncbi:hypothetical protein GGP62_002176 [Salinibacter ruber]|uniref:DUF4376 domain-containing protein n=1 Tax=Salinibacter ruber TaxID=146919 RepID=UPI00216A8973|nr:DUF4376 domain-containing protein [Salinibacter ruber]MCS3707189.1 hypothetical protein [Salinibacter ruber]